MRSANGAGVPEKIDATSLKRRKDVIDYACNHAAFSGEKTKQPSAGMAWGFNYRRLEAGNNYPLSTTSSWGRGIG
ncbi:MAG: hypothetical protein HYU46_20600 [Deltaproteobacteria bacterium]|nr:hypothetical protein [Deltaproteobacteria bacterium]MBI2367953.1 hypothetical protein [Deltaproteobacteria bacterium]MBI2534759.1 hypothetical protein [Deltaproteobacteria bacterium]